MFDWKTTTIIASSPYNEAVLQHDALADRASLLALQGSATDTEDASCKLHSKSMSEVEVQTNTFNIEVMKEDICHTTSSVTFHSDKQQGEGAALHNKSLVPNPDSMPAVMTVKASSLETALGDTDARAPLAPEPRIGYIERMSLPKHFAPL